MFHTFYPCRAFSRSLHFTVKRLWPLVVPGANRLWVPLEKFHIISPELDDFVEYFISCTSCTAFLLLVSQQNVLLHAAADWRGLSNRSSCRSCSSSHLDNSGSKASGDSDSMHLLSIFWKVPNETSPLLLVPPSLLWSRVRKRREHHSRGKAARKELRSVLLNSDLG